MGGDRGSQKRAGQAAAREWLGSARVEQVLELAGSRLEYGEVLDDLREEGFDLPRSSDADFSWGFYKKVKGHAHSKLRKR